MGIFFFSLREAFSAGNFKERNKKIVMERIVDGLKRTYAYACVLRINLQ